MEVAVGLGGESLEPAQPVELRGGDDQDALGVTLGMAHVLTS